MPFVSKKFIEAMQFYGCADSYKRRGVHPKGSPVRYEASPIVRDHGGRARAALEELQRRAILPRMRRFFQRNRPSVGPRVITVPGPLVVPADEVDLLSSVTYNAPSFALGSDGRLVLAGCVVASADGAADALPATDTHEA